ncbi:U6 snRNA phosphodiesterase Usb1 [Xylaria bambusicola]|uniref:U6 snRNA phosphodiesterase Usb1 n=1 Tax=Xylaria bambusicola TaxID=326684 RepID=UPI002008DE1B|nr:U6 snRNA phosphodiesterase Usb1 [Xylaria bambusicola]KAI0517151.1 U6 snRNA phosphodiesterase Usb1 [Xylaria bambusicola]
MGLVDYSDSDESEEAPSSPRVKRQKTSSDDGASRNTANDVLPPLPSAFHDLYASTVRVSANDDPTLHQGRKRVNPHKVGHWPSHLYIEWHPTSTERATLTTLLSTLQCNLNAASPSPSPHHTSITTFLTSDLGAPQPLHISLSRPIVLSTSQKDAFLSSLESRIRTSGIAPFELSPLGLQWHRTEESSRSFLVLRVGSRSSHHSHPANKPHNLSKPEKQIDEKSVTNKNDNDDTQNTNPPSPPRTTPPKSSNPQLSSLLSHTNAIATAFDQPPLYAWAKPSDNDSGSNQEDTLDGAFHISIAWSFALPSADLRRLTEEVLNTAYTISTTDADVHAPECAKTMGDAVRAMRVRVEGIKAKIGNIVTHIPLRNRRDDGGSRGLFGM